MSGRQQHPWPEHLELHGLCCTPVITLQGGSDTAPIYRQQTEALQGRPPAQGHGVNQRLLGVEPHLLGPKEQPEPCEGRCLTYSCIGYLVPGTVPPAQASNGGMIKVQWWGGRGEREVL